MNGSQRRNWNDRNSTREAISPQSSISLQTPAVLLWPRAPRCIASLYISTNYRKNFSFSSSNLYINDQSFPFFPQFSPPYKRLYKSHRYEYIRVDYREICLRTGNMIFELKTYEMVTRQRERIKSKDRIMKRSSFFKILFIPSYLFRSEQKSIKLEIFNAYLLTFIIFLLLFSRKK